MHAHCPLNTTSTIGNLPSRLIAIGFIALMISAGCGLESPKAPTWSAEFRVPLANRAMDVPYIVEHIDVDELQWSEDAGVTFHIDRVLDSVFVEDNLSVAPLSTNADVPLDGIRLATNATTSRTLALEELYQGPLGLIAAFSGETRQSLPEVADFQTAEVVEGALAVTVINDLGLTLDSVAVSLFNGEASDAFATVPVGGPIPTGSTASTNAALPPGTIGSQWDLELAFYTLGGTVLTAADKSVTVIAELPDGIQISSGSGAVSAFDYASRDSFAISSEHNIHEAEFTAGELSVHWQNNSPVPLTVNWHTDDIANGAGSLGGQVSIPAHSNDVQTFSLDGYAADLNAHQSRVVFDATVSSPGSAGSVVDIDTETGLAVEARFDDIVLSSGTLALAPTTQNIPELTTDLEWPNGLESIGLAEGTARIEITSSLPWPATVSGRVDVPGGEGIAFNGVVDAADEFAASVSSIDIGSVAALLNPLPQELVVTGDVTYGDGTTAASVSSEDYMVARVVFDAPAHLLLESATVDSDPEPIELTEDEDDNLDDRFLGGEITVDVANHLPLGGEILISIASDSLTLATNPELVLGPSQVAPASTNGNGDAVAATESQLTFILDKNDVALFERDSIWVSERLVLNGPGDGVPARIAVSDYVNWTATAVLSTRLGDRDNAEDLR
ncbi:MAG: hypothetical protein GF341_07205 [candidate division Zixibacteria bacterium]|nr:hypothetical protein [candidate division Zixibacteria bacterium]